MPKPVSVTPEDLSWAMQQLRRFEGLPGVPQSPEALMSFARAFLHIVAEQPATEIEEYDDEAHAPVRRKVESVSRQETVDWLINELLGSCDRFPPPIIMRRVYECRYRCADGRLSGEMGVSG